jgi:Spy/CpxP family protein refolding chaperone
MQTQRAAITVSNQTAPERLAQRAAFAKQRATNLDTMSAAVKDLYETLTPEQKAIADQRLAFGGMGGPGRRGGRGGWR